MRTHFFGSLWLVGVGFFSRVFEGGYLILVLGDSIDQISLIFLYLCIVFVQCLILICHGVHLLFERPYLLLVELSVVDIEAFETLISLLFQKFLFFHEFYSFHQIMVFQLQVDDCFMVLSLVVLQLLHFFLQLDHHSLVFLQLYPLLGKQSRVLKAFTPLH